MTTKKKQMRDAIDLAVWTAERTQAARNEEWNAAIEAAAKVADAESDYSERARAEAIKTGHTRTAIIHEERSLVASRTADDIRALKREAK